jgi:hypothetical protein
MTTKNHLDSFLLRVAYETLVQAHRDRNHPKQYIADSAQEFLSSEDASTIYDILVGNGALWSPPTGEVGRGKKGGRRWGARSVLLP